MFNGEPTPAMALSITPEPTPDQRDAIVAALVVIRNRRGESAKPERALEPTRWQRTARREAIRAGGFDDGWR